MNNIKEIAGLVILGFFLSLVVSSSVMAKERTMLSLTDAQKRALSSSTYWKLHVRHDYGKAKKYKGVPIDKDVKRLLQYAGWQTISSDKASYDVLFDISIKGKPVGGKYTTGYHYSGSRLGITASLKSADKTWSLTLPKSSGVKGCSPFISRSYRKPDNAPFKSAYYKNKDFFLALFSLMYQAKGVKPLSEGMNDSSLHRDIQKQLYHYIGSIQSKKLLKPLLSSMSTKTGDIKREVIITLGKMGDEKALPSLCIALLEDKNSKNREEAAKALAAIGNPKAVSALKKALLNDNNKDARLSVAEALNTLGWRPATTKEKVFYYIAKKEKQKVKAMGGEALPVFIEALKHSSRDIRQYATKTIGSGKFKEAVSPLCKMVLHESSRDVRKEAIFALGNIGDPKAIPSLCIALLEDKDSVVRKAAATALGTVGNPKTVGALSKALLNDKNSKVRSSAAEALGKIGDKKAIQALNTQLDKERDKFAKKAICDALMVLGSKKKLPLEFRITSLKKQKDWTALTSLLQTQKTGTLIEQLKSKDTVIKRMIAEILMERTGKYDLGTNYNIWKKWWNQKK